MTAICRSKGWALWANICAKKSESLLDIDNHAIMGKMIVDAMKGRVIEDDSRRWVKGVCHYFHDGDYISVEIREIS